MESFSIDIPKSTKYNADLLLEAAFQTYLNYSREVIHGIKYAFSTKKRVSKPIRATYKKLINHKAIATTDLFDMIYVLSYYMHFIDSLATQLYSKRKIHFISCIKRSALGILYAICEVIHDMKSQRLIKNSSKLIKASFLPQKIQQNLIARLHGKKHL